MRTDNPPAHELDRELIEVIRIVRSIAGSEVHDAHVTLRGVLIDLLRELRSSEAALSERIRSLVLDSPEVGVAALASELAMSRSTLHRRLRREGTTAAELLRITRLERAAELLSASCSVSQAASDAGFRSLAHFSRAFRDHFGVPPSQFATGRQMIATRGKAKRRRRT